MINGPLELPKPLQILVSRAISLCELMLPHCKALYPFAAIYEDGRVGCLFADDRAHGENESYLIEQLQWRIIDTTTDTDSYSVLVYAATVKTDRHKQLDAIAINATRPNGEETMLLYPYFRVGRKIVVSPPIHG
ncbi:hypothetical protein CA267_004460 [Alteromonas pelagimontana]|uniref:Uncharacterized protein n=1 Tax=Alteromonas pelagimontana TaxID=1858656 RepID=A0A6M4MA62_9ALTE|nr:hypothetical protein [Alteromonas pelagimontana]QJR80081.1 hypothetical protein CA267_004460 [Alteromonas pelagimontana]